MNIRNLSTRYACSLCLIALTASGAFSGAALAQERKVAGSTLVGTHWNTSVVSVNYGQKALSPLARNQVKVTLRVTNKTSLPLPVIGKSGLAFLLHGKSTYRLSSVNTDKMGLIPRGGAFNLTVTFPVPAEDQRDVRAIEISSPDPNVYNETGIRPGMTVALPPA